MFDISGEGRRDQETFARLVHDVNKWIRGVRWQAWNGTSCWRAVRIVQEKVRFHRDYWGTAAGVCCSPAGFQGRPTNPFLCSYQRQISSSLCVCGGRVIFVCGAFLRQRAKYSTHLVLSTVAGLPDNRLQGREVKWEVGQWGGNTASDYCHNMINHHNLNGATSLDNKWQISVSLILAWCLPLCSAALTIVKYYRMSPWDEATLIMNRD